MIATLSCKRLRIHARHGALPQEHLVGAWFYVGFEIQFHCSPQAYLNDELEGTINYADVTSCIERQMQTPSQLLEHLVFRTGNALLQAFPEIEHITLSISKENPPMKTSCKEIGIKMNFSRH